jgi:predicted TIM-barrel fold metal-dependent hydrolase
MPAFADKYPNMKLIIAHLGNDVFMDAVAAAKHGNIYVDTSGSASHGNNVVERAVKRIGAEHILFGTDGYSSAFQLARIAWADISDSDKKKILRDNALALFPGVFE